MKPQIFIAIALPEAAHHGNFSIYAHTENGARAILTQYLYHNVDRGAMHAVNIHFVFRPSTLLNFPG